MYFVFLQQTRTHHGRYNAANTTTESAMNLNLHILPITKIEHNALYKGNNYKLLYSWLYNTEIYLDKRPYDYHIGRAVWTKCGILSLNSWIYTKKVIYKYLSICNFLLKAFEKQLFSEDIIQTTVQMVQTWLAYSVICDNRTIDGYPQTHCWGDGVNLESMVSYGANMGLSEHLWEECHDVFQNMCEKNVMMYSWTCVRRMS